MKPLKLIVVITFSTFFAVACARNSETSVGTPSSSGASAAASATATPDEFAATRAIFKERCSKCHGESGDGGPVTVDGKKLKVPSFKVGHALKHSDVDFFDQIHNGGDGMPPFKDKLNAQEITDLVRFIRKEFQHK